QGGLRLRPAPPALFEGSAAAEAFARASGRRLTRRDLGPRWTRTVGHDPARGLDLQRGVKPLAGRAHAADADGDARDVGHRRSNRRGARVELLHLRRAELTLGAWTEPADPPSC